MSVREIRQEIQAIRAADDTSPGSTLRGGDEIGVWEAGDHPYGQPLGCPFCRAEQNYTSFEFNGEGPPPQYAFTCGDCGAQGPFGTGSGRGDHIGARTDAVNLWNKGTQR